MGNTTSAAFNNFFNEIPKEEVCYNKDCNKIIQIYHEEFFRFVKNKNIIEKCSYQSTEDNNGKIIVSQSIQYNPEIHTILDSLNCIFCNNCGTKLFTNTLIETSVDPFNTIISNAQKVTSLCSKLSNQHNNKTMTKKEYDDTKKLISSLSRQIDAYASENKIKLQNNGIKYYCSICDGLWIGEINSNAAAFTTTGKFICDKCFPNFCCADKCKKKSVWICKLCKFGFCGSHLSHELSIKKELISDSTYHYISCDITESGKNYWKETVGYVRKKVWNYERSVYI